MVAAQLMFLFIHSLHIRTSDTTLIGWLLFCWLDSYVVCTYVYAVSKFYRYLHLPMSAIEVAYRKVGPILDDFFMRRLQKCMVCRRSTHANAVHVCVGVRACVCVRTCVCVRVRGCVCMRACVGVGVPRERLGSVSITIHGKCLSHRWLWWCKNVWMRTLQRILWIIARLEFWWISKNTSSLLVKIVVYNESSLDIAELFT